MAGKWFVEKVEIKLDIVRKSFSVLDGGSSVSSYFLILEFAHNKVLHHFVHFLEQPCYSQVTCLTVDVC